MHGLWPLLFSTRHSFPRDLLLLLLHSLQHRSRCETAPGLSATAPNGAPGFPGGSSVAQGAPPRPGAQPSSPSRRRAVQAARLWAPSRRRSFHSIQTQQWSTTPRTPSTTAPIAPLWLARRNSSDPERLSVREFCSCSPAAHKLPSIELRTWLLGARLRVARCVGPRFLHSNCQLPVYLPPPTLPRF